MDYSDALKRLRNHANTPNPDLPESESFLFEVWQAEREFRDPRLQNLFHDILDCFEAINHEINTKHPSNNVSGKAEALPRTLVADVSAILSVSWRRLLKWSATRKFTESFREEFANMLLKISMGWSAVLAGDIDDIREYIHTYPLD
jgi:hypothetical protein